jgi:hypothetical protein
MSEIIGGEHRFKKPFLPEGESEGQGEVTPLDLVQNLEVIQGRLMDAVKVRTDLMRVPNRTEEQQTELDAKETEITELRALASGQLIREGRRRFAADSGPPRPQDSSV